MLVSLSTASLLARLSPDNSPLFLPTLSPPRAASGGERPRSFLSLDTALLVPGNNKDDFDIYIRVVVFFFAPRIMTRRVHRILMFPVLT